MEWILLAALMLFFVTTILFGVMWILSRKPKETDRILNESVGLLKEEIVRRREELSRLQQEKAQTEAAAFELRAQVAAERSRNEALSLQITELNKQISAYRADEKSRDAQTDAQITELKTATRVLHDEKERLQAEERERLRLAEENRSRLWKEHEAIVQARLRDICKNPAYAYPVWSNDDLPEAFIKFKPDCLVEFRDQYLLFDAKKTSEKNPNTYIKGQVEKTVDKIKESGLENLIFRIVVLVVPRSNLTELKQLVYFHGGFTFFVVSEESLEPLMASFKEIEKYTVAEQYDPADREKIINLIALFDTHIRKQNAVNLLTAAQGLTVLGEKNRLPGDIYDDVENRRRQIRYKGFGESDMKKLMSDPMHEIEALRQLVQRHVPEEVSGSES